MSKDRRDELRPVWLAPQAASERPHERRPPRRPEVLERHRRALGRALGRDVSTLTARADRLSLEGLADDYALVSRESLAELRRRSRVDAKTGLWSYGAFIERLDSEIARASRHGQTLALIMADIDGLKGLNDRHGHLAGDRALVACASILRGSCRANDICARYGGDELALIVPHADEDTGMHLARRILQSARSSLSSFGVGVSLGVASWPWSDDDSRQLIAAADEALYAAKRAGGRRVRVYSNPRESIPA